MHIVDLARAGKLSLVEQALHKGEGVNSRCFRNGSTPLIAAAAQGHLPLVKLLLDANADVNAINHDLATALIAASPTDHKDVVQLLVESDAQLNLVNVTGNAAFDEACNAHQDGVARYLHAQGATSPSRQWTVLPTSSESPRSCSLPRSSTAVAVCRILGNDLPFLHSDAQTETNTRFILEHAEIPGNVFQLFFLNRIANPIKLANLKSLLDRHGQHWVEIPFCASDFESLGKLDDGLFAAFDDLLAAPIANRYCRSMNSLWRQLAFGLLPFNLYLVNNNGARNFAIQWCRRHTSCEWIFILDGNCFFSSVQWSELFHGMNSEAAYILVPMLLIEKNDQIYSKSNSFAQRAVEPQVAFHRHRAHTHFHEGIPYGFGPKAELLQVITDRKCNDQIWSRYDSHHRIMGIQRPAVQVGFEILSSVYRLAPGAAAYDFDCGNDILRLAGLIDLVQDLQGIDRLRSGARFASACAGSRSSA